MDRDDLLQPSLAGQERRPVRQRPWRLGSQVYVAFFGGALAVGGIGAFNAGLLGMPRRAQLAIGAIALAAEAALIVLVVATGTDEVRFASIGAGLLAFGGIYLIQRSPDRVYHYHADAQEPYESLFGAGLAACLVARLVEAVLVFGVFGQ